MGDILNEVNGIVQCRQCPWYKSCAMPMRFTADDIRRQMEATPGLNFAQTADQGLQGLLSSMATAAQNSMLEACPVFIDRLRSSPRLAQKLKQIMLNWADESTPTETDGSKS